MVNRAAASRVRNPTAGARGARRDGVTRPGVWQRLIGAYGTRPDTGTGSPPVAPSPHVSGFDPCAVQPAVAAAKPPGHLREGRVRSVRLDQQARRELAKMAASRPATVSHELPVAREHPQRVVWPATTPCLALWVHTAHRHILPNSAWQRPCSSQCGAALYGAMCRAQRGESIESTRIGVFLPNAKRFSSFFPLRADCVIVNPSAQHPPRSCEGE